MTSAARRPSVFDPTRQLVAMIVNMEIVHPAGGGGTVEVTVHPEWAPLGAQ